MKLTKARAVVIATALNNLKFEGQQRCDSPEQAAIHYELIDRIEDEVRVYLKSVGETRSMFDIIRRVQSGNTSVDDLLKRRVVARVDADGSDSAPVRSNKLIDLI